jgi:hypothetical protein
MRKILYLVLLFQAVIVHANPLFQEVQKRYLDYIQQFDTIQSATFTYSCTVQELPLNNQEANYFARQETNQYIQSLKATQDTETIRQLNQDYFQTMQQKLLSGSQTQTILKLHFNNFKIDLSIFSDRQILLKSIKRDNLKILVSDYTPVLEGTRKDPLVYERRLNPKTQWKWNPVFSWLNCAYLINHGFQKITKDEKSLIHLTLNPYSSNATYHIDLEERSWYYLPTKISISNNNLIEETLISQYTNFSSIPIPSLITVEKKAINPLKKYRDTKTTYQLIDLPDSK